MKIRSRRGAPGSARPVSRLRAADTWPLAVLGLASRPARATLSALGVALGIATMVAVLGISSSSRAQLVAQIDALGTNLLTWLGAAAALGIDRADGVQVWLGKLVQRHRDPAALPLAPELDRTALIGYPVAERLLHAAAAP